MYLQYTMNIILNILKINEKITCSCKKCKRHLISIGVRMFGGRVVKVRSFLLL